MDTWLTENVSMVRHFVLALLDQLGTASNQVATSLEDKGIHGQRLARRCLNPIVQYLSRNVSGCWAAEVLDDQIQLYFIDRQAEGVPIPAAVREFLEEFDHGSYPSLELTPAHSEMVAS